ncbi:ComEA family DNA-binding protein [Secundilactobacillus oryzae]|uniref:ComEA family DNA-binding protein n=1 Tax=Secundilactobacillus oryzae TaxID=1202668 RepID=UPI0006CFB449|nr:ComEA family DNA-binding protein [Secundilactobacillus oryzae]
MDRLKELYQEYRIQILLGLVAVMAVVLIGVGMMLMGHHEAPSDAQPTSLSTSSSQTTEVSGTTTASSNHFRQSGSTDDHKQIMVDVKGAVKNPGVFQVTATMRVKDVVDLAGGFNSSADQKHINLAQTLSDQQVIYVPVKGEVKGNPGSLSGTPVTSSSPTGDESASSESSQINLNDADATQLQQISGIGEKKAQQIIQYRDEHGPFKSVQDLKNISGFGDKTVEKKLRIVLQCDWKIDRIVVNFCYTGMEMLPKGSCHYGR